MISCQERTAARTLTLPQFERLGITPIVIPSPCDPPGWQQNVTAGHAALEVALESGSKWVLFVEDDIDLAPDFGAALQQSIGCRYDVVYLYVHDRPDRVQNLYGAEWESIEQQLPQRARVIPAKRYGALYGSQAVLMSRQAAFKAWAVTLQAKNATDTSLVKAWARSRTPVGIRVPHAVQHRADKTLHDRRAESSRRDPQWQTSRSYSLPRS